jgi:hypothetical protein
LVDVDGVEAPDAPPGHRGVTVVVVDDVVLDVEG